MALTHNQRTAHTVNRARGRLHFEQLRRFSAEGLTKAEAAQQLSLTIAGINSLLWKKAGSTRWPITE